MSMINTNYCIGALDILLDRSCLSERYFPLIPLKDSLISQLQLMGCKTKNDASSLSDEALMLAGLDGPDTVRLLRRFLTIYDPNPQKFKEITKLCTNPEEQTAFRELYHLPGVKYVRANLYYRSGYSSIMDFAETTEKEVLSRTAAAITDNDLSCIVPLPKEVRTHIAVSKAFMWE